MSGEVRSPRLGPALLTALLAAGPSLSGPVQAQIVTDGSVGPRASLSGPNIEIGADLGTRRGDNLFHSFVTFGIAPGQTATFTAINAHPLEKVKSAIAKAHRAKTRRLRSVFAL